MAAAPATAARKTKVALEIFHALNESGFSTSLRESDWTFSWVETVHVLSLAVMAGTIAVVDFRLLGIAFQRQPVSRLVNQVTPVTWVGFALMVISGTLLFVAQPEKNAVNPAFQIKMLLLVLAGLNLLTFHRYVFKDFAAWDDQARPPLKVRFAGGASLVLWSVIIILGRLIAYFPDPVTT
jgi:hypothetical protein